MQIFVIPLFTATNTTSTRDETFLQNFEGMFPGFHMYNVLYVQIINLYYVIYKKKPNYSRSQNIYIIDSTVRYGFVSSISKDLTSVFSVSEKPARQM